MEPGADWLSDLLQHVQLEQFYLPIRDQLQITRLAHFDYVHADDLEKIGISKPGVRRLFDAVRKRKLLLWNRKFWNKLFGSSSLSREKTDLALKPAPTETRTTCIILEKDLVLHNELGNGSFGVVKRGEWKVSDQQTLPVAVKVLKADAFTQPGIYDDFRREMEAMHSLKHSNLIKLHGVVFHPLMMVCELAPMGALLDYIRAQDGKVSLNYISKWSEQVAAGMAHLEKNRFLHRDLACRNILLSNLELVKIGDFGLMRALPSSDDCYVMSERRRVPFPWCAPESLRTRQFSHASDVWMFAVALWEMYSFGEEPWIGLNGSEILRLIMREGQRLSAPAACPPDVYMLMMQCWDLNPKERPTFAGILRYMETNKFETAVASLSYKKQGQMSMDSGDTIILIDKRPELHSWKGQNQRTLEVGLFPSTLVSVSIRKSKKPSPKKADTLSGPRGNLVSPKSTPILNGSRDDVVLRNRRTIESTQPTFTRSGNSGSKHFNYNKLVNDRAGLHTHRAQRDAYSKSLNHVREDLLIDLDLPPATGQNVSQNKTLTQEISLLDQPIDVPESGLEVDWGEQSIESLPSFSSAAASYAQSATNLNGARSVDNLSLSMGSPDPFDTSHFWPVNNHSPAKTTVNRTRPNYAIQLAGTSAAQHRNEESHRYSTNSIPTTVFDTKIYNNVSNSIVQNLGIESIYDSSKSWYSGSVNSVPCTVPNSITNVLNEHASVESGVATAIASMSLDDRISESLNLRTKNTNDENIYMNSAFNDAPSTSSANVPNNDRYKDIPIYNNTSYEINPVEQQFLLETKDYYTKFSTPVKCEDDYSKNIYVPKHEDDGKLHNFSDDLQNSKNYSSKKYQNVEYSQYGAGYSADSHWSEYTDYDEEHGTDTNIYSEIPEPSNTRVNQTYSNINRVYSNTSQAVYSSNSVNNQPVYSSSGTSSHTIYSTNPNDFSNSSALYDEVYESVAPRPHRPAPPRPTNPK